nr:hypothetical protein [Candidatus Acidoferrales bacterium]
MASPRWADDASTKAARELVQKIAAQIDHKKKVMVEVADMTGEMRAAELDDAKKMIESELRARGLRTVADSSFDVKVRITLSQDLIERIWVAEYEAEGTRAVLVAQFEHTGLDIRPWMTGAHLDRELIFSDNALFLDFVECRRPTKETCGAELVLFPKELMGMKGWESFPDVLIAHEKPTSRDVRGRIRLIDGRFESRIEDAICSGDTNLSNPKCVTSKNPWSFWGPGGESANAILADGQNWFTWVGGALPNADAKREPFFSLAGIEVNGEPGWISSGTDGKVRIFNNKTGEILGTAAGWGSELAAVKTECGNGWQILATRQRDRTETDAVTVFEWTGSEFRALTDPLEMNGTIVSMWSADGEGPARAVVHNLKTGNYEAYLLKVGCSQ